MTFMVYFHLLLDGLSEAGEVMTGEHSEGLYH
jgi:hypothetical protein